VRYSFDLRLIFSLIKYFLGEYAAAVACGIFSKETALRLVYRRSCLISNENIGTEEAMIAMKVSIFEVQDALRKLAESKCGQTSIKCNDISIAAVIGPKSVVLSGYRHILSEFITIYFPDVTCKYLSISRAYHSDLLSSSSIMFGDIFDEILSDQGSVVFKNSIIECSTNQSMKFVSCLSGSVISASDLLEKQYWMKQMTKTVNYYESLKTMSLVGKESETVFIEIGPHNVLLSMASSFINNNSRNALFIPSMKRGDNDSFKFFESSFREFYVSSKMKLNVCHNVFSDEYFGRKYSPVLIPWRENPSILKLNCQNHKRVDNSSSDPIFETIKTSLSRVLTHHESFGDRVVALDSSFSSLGVDSLGALSFRSILTQSLGLSLTDIPVTAIFENCPTVRSLVKYIEEIIFKRTVPVSEDRTSMVSTEDDSNIQIVEFPVTTMQLAMIFHCVADDSQQSSFIESFTWDFCGSVDIFNVNVFKSAWVDLLLTYPSLLSSFDPFAIPRAHQIISQ